MDTGKFKNNIKFYNGYEDEPEITLEIIENPQYNIHIWDGNFTFIFGNPNLDGNGWKGFTRDYNQMENVFGGDDEYLLNDIKEYLDDLLAYSNKTFENRETKECYKLICDFLEFALKNGYHILIRIF
ncbi:MAG: hypothetical protein LIO87_05070 [Eubacterium sp.]|nr:hypothetical protein [Eubacterium sp.]